MDNIFMYKLFYLLILKCNISDKNLVLNYLCNINFFFNLCYINNY